MGTKLIKQNAVTNDKNILKFKELAEATVSLFHANGIFNIVPFHDPQLPIFSSLPKVSQEILIIQISNYFESFVSASVGNIVNEKQALWLALKTLGLRPTSDIFEIINSEDSVEAYDLHGIQFWRNLKFLQVCSYSIEEIFSIPWSERYIRDSFAEKRAHEIVYSLITSSCKETQFHHLKDTLVEKYSSKKLTIDVNHKCISPIYDSYNRVAGFIVVSGVKVLEKSKGLSPDITL